MQTRSLGRVGGPGSIVQSINPDTHRKPLLSVHTATATCRIRTIELRSVHVCRQGWLLGISQVLGLLSSSFEVLLHQFNVLSDAVGEFDHQ
jgi:hypothetical protein